MTKNIIKSKKSAEYIYWVFFKFVKKMKLEKETPDEEDKFEMVQDEGWTFLTVPALIVSNQQLLFYQKQIAKDLELEGVLIKYFNLVITR